jgi:hypothetical protein
LAGRDSRRQDQNGDGQFILPGPVTVRLDQIPLPDGTPPTRRAGTGYPGSGFDLGFEMSASDMVRCIWAYRIGLLEVGREFAETRHAQLLVFDEPRQQSADPLSFTALFERAALAEITGQQVIFATSEPEGSLQAMLRGIPHSYLGFAGKMISRLDQ